MANVPIYISKVICKKWGGVKSRICFPLTPTNFRSVSTWPTLPACWYHAKQNISGKYVHRNGERICCFTLTRKKCLNFTIPFGHLTCLSHAGWCGTIRIISISVASPKVVKASRLSEVTTASWSWEVHYRASMTKKDVLISFLFVSFFTLTLSCVFLSFWKQFSHPTWLGQIGWCDTDRIIPAFVTPPMVPKAKRFTKLLR